ncbi:MAG: hypothetical protein GY756_17285 [bacterium]|nr:hypothetical protein [bacterium]
MAEHEPVIAFIDEADAEEELEELKFNEPNPFENIPLDEIKFDEDETSATPPNLFDQPFQPAFAEDKEVLLPGQTVHPAIDWVADDNNIMMLSNLQNMNADAIATSAHNFVQNLIDQGITLNDLNPDEQKDLVNYVQTYVRNDQLKRAIFHIINTVSDAGLGDLPISLLQIEAVEGEEFEEKFPMVESVEQLSFKLKEELDDSVVLFNRAFNEAKTNREIREMMVPSFRFVKNVIKQLEDLEFADEKEVEQYAQWIEMATSDNTDDDTRIEAFTHLVTALNTKVLTHKVGHQRKFKKFKPRRLFEAKVSKGLAKTELNMKEFLKQLNAELKQIEKKDNRFIQKMGKEFRRGIAVHQAHKEHELRNIKVLSDNVKKIKEVIVEPLARGDDMLNLAHMLVREPGVLMTLDGETIIKLKGRAGEAARLLDILIKTLAAQPKNHALRLIYKPALKHGGHFLGGTFHDVMLKNNDHINLMSNLRQAPFSGHGVPIHPMYRNNASVDFLNRICRTMV